MAGKQLVAGPDGVYKEVGIDLLQITPEELAGANGGNRPDLITAYQEIYQLTTDANALYVSNGFQLVAASSASVGGGGGSSAIAGMTALSIGITYAADGTPVQMGSATGDEVICINTSKYDVQYLRNGVGEAITIPRGATRRIPIVANANELHWRRADWATAADVISAAAPSPTLVMRVVTGGRQFASEQAVSASIVGQATTYVAFPSTVCDVVELANVYAEGLTFKVNSGAVVQWLPGTVHMIPVTNANQVSVCRAQTSNNATGYTTKVTASALVLAPSKSLTSVETGLTRMDLAGMISPKATMAFGELRSIGVQGLRVPAGLMMAEPYVAHRKPGRKLMALNTLSANMLATGGSALSDAAPLVDGVFGTTVPQAQMNGTNRYFGPAAVMGTPINITAGAIHLMLALSITTGLTGFQLEVFSAGSPSAPPANYTTTATGDYLRHAQEILNRNLQGAGHFMTIGVSAALLTNVVGTGANLSAITWYRIKMDSVVSGPIVAFGPAEYVPNILTGGVAMFSFDDFVNVTYTQVAPRMAAYNMPGMMMGSPQSALGDNLMTQDQILTLQDKFGWQVCSQDYSNSDTVSEDGGNDWLTLNSQNLLLAKALGFRGGRDGSAYSTAGGYNMAGRNGSWKQQRKLYRTIATAVGGLGGSPPEPFGEVFPYADPWSIRRQNLAAITLSEAQAMVDKANTVKGVAHFFMHGEVLGGADANTVKFEGLLAYIASIGMPVKTQDEMFHINLRAAT